MPSTFAWVDFSEAERRRTQDVLDLFHERDTRDELGIGVVRDALADLLFPGTSTLHTRARYFLFVPWTYQRLAKKGVGRADIARKARKAELDLITPLSANEDRDGVIGAVAEDTLKRLPSSMYWAGLGTWGIRLFPGSQAQFHHAFDRLRTFEEFGDDDEQVAPVRRPPWDPQLPAEPDDFPEAASFRLTRDEAQYLQHRIQAMGPTLLAQLVRRGARVEMTDFPWQRSDAQGWPEDLLRQIEHARCFSELMHGAALLYNLMLAEAVKDEALGANYRQLLGQWGDLVRSRGKSLAEWRRTAFWELLTSVQARVSTRTRGFVDGWLDLALGGPANAIPDDAGAREMVRRREQQLKRGRARLGNPGALARWTGAAGAAQLNFRWHRIQPVTADILRGLAGEA